MPTGQLETIKEYVVPKDCGCRHCHLIGIAEPPIRFVCQIFTHFNRTDLTHQELFDTIKTYLPLDKCPELRINPIAQSILGHLDFGQN